MLAWLAVLAAGGGLAAYAIVDGPDARPVDDRPRLSMSLPEPPAPQPADVAETARTLGDATGDAAGDAAGDSADDTEATAAGESEAVPAADVAQRQNPDATPASEPNAQDTTADDGAADQGNAQHRTDGADGVAVNIPQPPTGGQDRPVDLLTGTDSATPPNADRSETGQQTASRRDPADPPAGDGGSAARLPQLPVSDPDAPAWKRYAQRMTPPEGVPKIAIIVRGLGLSSAAAETAVNQLPASVSLSFTPYARDRAKAWAAEARRNGHEVLVDLPMEPANYPATDPGPQAIMTDVNTRENLQRLEWLLGQVDREVGAVAQMGSAVLADRQVAEPVLRALKDRGLMFVDNGALADSAAREIARRLGLPFAVNDRTLDGGQVSRRAIEARLVEAERLAREQGLAVVMAHPYPVSLELLVGWTEELEARGFVLVPATYAATERAGRNAAQLR
jgi:polysaccharide deacetylase 2 family uncharacterized protein YibQ